MKHLLSLLFAMLVSINAVAGTLKEAEAADLIAKIEAMMVTFEKGDPKALIAQTHPSAFRLAGTKEQFERLAREAMVEMDKMKFKFVSSTYGTPSQTYKAGNEEVVFVPRISIISVNDMKGRGTGYMVAIRTVGSKQWKFLDGAVFAKKPEMLYTMLPKLERNITLPPYGVERL